MNTFDVYPLFQVEPVKATGCWVYDKTGKAYLDFYGGHAVISVGHSHPHYVKRIENQLKEIAFYSNSVLNSLQLELADKLGAMSGYDKYQLFLVNSGAEATENAIKLAGFHNQRNKILVFDKGFHGRTSMAVQATDNPKIQTSLDQNDRVIRIPLNDIDLMNQYLTEDISCVLIEGIQGVGGINLPEKEFLEALSVRCKNVGALLILDEIQSGYGRTGKFFAHQFTKVRPDLITIAKGMGNGFPVGGVLINPIIKPSFGMLGTTFGGNHLACAASLAVLEIIEQEDLMNNASQMGEILKQELSLLSSVKEVRGKGLMIAADFDFPIKDIRRRMVTEHQLFTGASSNPHALRLLPPLGIGENEVELMVDKLKTVLK